MLAAELPEHERLIDDPFARLVVDDRAIAAARADENLQNTLRLRTRYIDDAVITFATRHATQDPQVLLLGAGFDARAYRLDVPAAYFEVDFPATLDDKAELLAAHTPVRPRTAVPVDLAERGFVEPLVDAGFRTDRPTIVVWEGVSMYLDADDRRGRDRADRRGHRRRRDARRRLRRDVVVQGHRSRTQHRRDSPRTSSEGGERLKAGVPRHARHPRRQRLRRGRRRPGRGAPPPLRPRRPAPASTPPA